MNRIFFRGLLLVALILAAISLRSPGPPRTVKELSQQELRATLKGYPGDWRPDTDREKGLPEPPRQKPVPPDAVRIALPAPDTAKTDAITVPDALRHRRSRRAFTGEPLTTAELGFLLWSAQGVTRKAETATDRSFRTAPSAGALYPLETYLLALRVDGVPAGIHRYMPDAHELVTVRTDPDGNLPAAIVAAAYGQEFVGNAAAVIVWAAVPERTEWKYGYLAPRMIAMEAGHACQNLYLACETIGAGACAMLGYDQVRLDTLLGVDGENEFAIYLAPVGKVTR
jgi:SagB-type dehydrogenase family enzyme